MATDKHTEHESYDDVSRIAVLYSLDDEWSETRIQGAIKTATQISEILDRHGLMTQQIAVREDIFEVMRYLDPTDIVFNLVKSLKGVSNGDVLAATVLEESGLSYTGSDYVCLDQCRDKFHLNTMCQSLGIRVPESTLVLDTDQDLSHVEFPAIVKPNHGAYGLGIGLHSVVKNASELQQRVFEIWHDHEQPPVIEEYIDGRELLVPVFGNAPRQILPMLEIRFDGLPDEIPKILGTSCICPTALNLQLLKEVELLATRATQVAGCRDYAMVEFRIDKNDVPYLIEINPNPDISQHSAYYRAMQEADFLMEDFVMQMADWAHIRSKAERADDLKESFGA